MLHVGLPRCRCRIKLLLVVEVMLLLLLPPHLGVQQALLLLKLTHVPLLLQKFVGVHSLRQQHCWWQLLLVMQPLLLHPQFIQRVLPLGLLLLAF